MPPLPSLSSALPPSRFGFSVGAGEALAAVRLWRELAPESDEAAQYFLGFSVLGDDLALNAQQVSVVVVRDAGRRRRIAAQLGRVPLIEIVSLPAIGRRRIASTEKRPGGSVVASAIS